MRDFSTPAQCTMMGHHRVTRQACLSGLAICQPFLPPTFPPTNLSSHALPSSAPMAIGLKSFITGGEAFAELLYPRLYPDYLSEGIVYAACSYTGASI